MIDGWTISDWAGLGATAALALMALAAGRSARFRSLAFTVWVLAFAAAAAWFPALFIRWGDFELKRIIVPLIQLIMLGMGMTLRLEDFARVLRMPRSVLAGMGLQFTVMPLAGYTFARAFGLDGEVAAGLILVGSCAGGVASNVITYIARGNVALSVTMTACSTLAAPIATPLAMSLLAGRYVPIEVWPMMQSILTMIVAPVVIGVMLNRYAHRLVARVSGVLPAISMLGICLIIAITIALSRDDLLRVGLALLLASVCHNATGFTLGYWGGRVLGLDEADCRTVAIEVGMQNGGMATGLAFNVLKSPVAALASAVFGPWSAIVGSMLASFWRRTALTPRSLSDPAVATPASSAV